MEAVQASQHVYVVKVRARPDPALLFPSERRYSALTVAGLAAGHALLGGVALLLGALALSWDPPQGPWVGHLGAGLWLGAAALQASACGVLAWRRWYEDRYIAWFFRSSILAAVVAGAGLVLTATALAHLHENVLSLTAPFVDHAAPALLPSAVADEGSGGDSSWLDLGDSNSSTISSGGVFSDLVRDQEHDLVAADSTRHEDLAGLGSLGLGSLGGAGSAEPAEHPEPPSGELEWSVLRWVPVPISPRASAQVRSLVGANVLVACLLELLWSLLGARLAWRGMQRSDADVDLSAPAKEKEASRQPHNQHGASGAAPAVPAMAILKPPLAALERGAADGKVDADADQPADGPDGPAAVAVANEASRRPKLQQPASAASAASAASLQRRRRAPELPAVVATPATPATADLPADLERMDLEERVARLVGESASRSASPPAAEPGPVS